MSPICSRLIDTSPWNQTTGKHMDEKLCQGSRTEALDLFRIERTAKHGSQDFLSGMVKLRRVIAVIGPEKMSDTPTEADFWKELRLRRRY